MKKLFIFLFLLPSFIFSEESKNIFSEIRKIKNLLKSYESQSSKEYKLNRNLVSALRTTIKRKFVDYELQLKDLNPANIKYQQSDKDSFIYYVRYKELYAVYFFINDPKLFLQFPIEERTYEKSPWMKLSTLQKETPPTQNSNKKNDTNQKTE